LGQLSCSTKATGVEPIASADITEKKTRNEKQNN